MNTSNSIRLAPWIVLCATTMTSSQLFAEAVTTSVKEVVASENIALNGASGTVQIFVSEPYTYNYTVGGLEFNLSDLGSVAEWNDDGNNILNLTLTDDYTTLYFNSNVSFTEINVIGEGKKARVTTGPMSAFSVNTFNAGGLAEVEILNEDYTPTFGTYPDQVTHLQPATSYSMNNTYIQGVAGNQTNPMTVTLNGGRGFDFGPGTYSSLAMDATGTETDVTVEDGADITFVNSLDNGNRVNSCRFGAINFTMNGGTVNAEELRSNEGGADRTANIRINGGTFNVTGSTTEDGTGADFIIGHETGHTDLTIKGGEIIAEDTPLVLGWDGTSTVNISEGTLKVRGVIKSADKSTAQSINVNPGGVLSLGAQGFNNHPNVTATLNGGAVLAHANNTIAKDFTLYGETISIIAAMPGKEATFSGDFSGTGGLLIGVTGLTGRINLAGANTYTGYTGVTRGTTLGLSGTLSPDTPLIDIDEIVGDADGDPVLLTYDLQNLDFTSAKLATLPPGTALDSDVYLDLGITVPANAYTVEIIDNVLTITPLKPEIGIKDEGNVPTKVKDEVASVLAEAGVTTGTVNIAEEDALLCYALGLDLTVSETEGVKTATTGAQFVVGSCNVNIEEGGSLTVTVKAFATDADGNPITTATLAEDAIVKLIGATDPAALEDIAGATITTLTDGVAEFEIPSLSMGNKTSYILRAVIVIE